MTEKRFTLTHINEQYLSTNLYDNRTFIGSIGIGAELIVELLNNFSEENEQLRKDVDYWKQVASQYSNELNVFEHCKKYKTECKDIYWNSD